MSIIFYIFLNHSLLLFVIPHPSDEQIPGVTVRFPQDFSAYLSIIPNPPIDAVTHKPECPNQGRQQSKSWEDMKYPFSTFSEGQGKNL